MAPSSVSPQFDKVGYWSPNTASIDWCENNYVVTPYIAEFWNSTSSMAILILASMGYFALPKGAPKRHRLTMATFAIIGLGSVLFHGTLRHKMQLLDELPMLYSATVMMFICIETKYGKQGVWLRAVLALWLALTTYIFSTTTGTIQSISFQTNYMLMQFGMIYYLRDFHVERRAIRPNPDVSTLIRSAWRYALSAATVWLVDYNLCIYINGVSPESFFSFNPQFHAWWHLFSCVAVYHLAILIIYYHHDMRNEKPFITKKFGFVPAITFNKTEALYKKKKKQ
ncbi:dihydroceramidase [Entomortierella parvispora]|uniref:Dihydroceramidase n=1 Tax=Entomortierella parvispora TaxID=205924 RepID=A0A9P3H6M5_9FUNG|nr:dihydroceramidase [Entomortierella parvispora]